VSSSASVGADPSVRQVLVVEVLERCVACRDGRCLICRADWAELARRLCPETLHCDECGAQLGSSAQPVYRTTKFCSIRCRRAANKRSERQRMDFHREYAR